MSIESINALIQYGMAPGETLLRRVGTLGDVHLEAVDRSALGFIDRVRLFFGFPPSDLDLCAIQQVAQEALQKSSDSILQSCKEGISSAVIKLNTSIEHHNARHWFRRPFIDKIFIQVRGEPPASSPKKPTQRQDISLIKPREELEPPQEPVADDNPSAVVEPHAATPQAPPVGKIRGLVNPLCLCYSNSSFVALCSSPAFRKVLQEEATKGGIAQLLENFFQDMEDQSLLGTPLDRGKEGSSLQLLHAELCKDDALSFLNHVDKQQDAQEFIIKLLALALNGHETFGLTGYTKRAPESLQAPKNALLEGIHIPSVDRPKGRSELESMVVVEIPDEAVVYSLNDFFEGTTREEPADFMAILNNERGHKSLENAPPEQVAAIEKASEYGDIIGTIEAKTTHRLDQPVPSFLPIYIPRFTEKGAKNTSEVRAPYRLSVPVKGGGTALYELKSVAVHSGATKQSGHYYTYLPDPSTVDPALGYPTRWIKASDSQEKRAVDWSTEAAQDISTNGVFFMYDRIGNAS